MKRIIALTLISILCSIIYAQNPKYKVSVWHTDGTKESKYISAIDSITFSEMDNGRYQQNIWMNSVSYSAAIDNIDSVSVIGSIIEYTIIEEAIDDFVGGIVTHDGAYCLLQKNDSINGYACYIGERESGELPLIVRIDTLGVIRNIFCNGTMYDFIFKEKSFDIIVSEDGGTNIVSDVSYDIFTNNQQSSRIRRADGISNGVDGWAEMADKISTVAAIGQIASNPKALSSKIGVLTLIGGMSENKYVRRSSMATDLIISLFTRNYLSAIWDLYKGHEELVKEAWFGDVKITTLGAEHITDTSYRVWCGVTNMSKLSDLDNMGVQLMMTLQKRPVFLGERLSDNATSLIQDYIKDDGAYYFEFDNLVKGQQYCFQPRLYRTWIEYHGGAENMTLSDIFTYGGAFPGGGISPVICRSGIYLYSDIGTFATNSTEILSIETIKTEVTKGNVNFTIEVNAKGYAAPNNDNETLGTGSLGIYIKNGEEYKPYPASSISGHDYTTELSIEESISTMDCVDFSTFVATKAIEIGSYVMAYRRNSEYDYEEVYYYSEPQQYELVYDKKPTAITLDVFSTKMTSAVVKCKYEGWTFWDGECGIEYTSNDSHGALEVTPKNDKEQKIQLTGLTPSTTYTYRAYCLVNGEYYYGEVKEFTTKATEEEIPIKIKDIEQTGSHYKEDGYSYEGKTYSYKYDVTLTVEFTNSEDVEELGYVFEDPNGNIRRLSRKGLKSPTHDIHIALCNEDKAVIQFYGYVKYKGSDDYLYSELIDFMVHIPYITCPDDNHPHMIDLGLPSGTKWACCNVDASKPEEYGGYFAWGETEEKDYYDSSTYKYRELWKDGFYIGEEDIEDIAGTEYDVAHVKWGGNWTMPTLNQFDELVNTCSWYWTSLNGVIGIVVAGLNGEAIFLPAGGSFCDDQHLFVGEHGAYWLSKIRSLVNSGDAWGFGFDSWRFDRGSEAINRGRLVRAVCP